MGVPDEAALKVHGDYVREELLLDGVRNVGAQRLLCLRSGLESYKAGIT